MTAERESQDEMVRGVCHIALHFRPYYSGASTFLERKLFPLLNENGVRNLVIAANYDDAPGHEAGANAEIYRVNVPKHSKRKEVHFALGALPILYRLRKEYEVIQFNGFWDRFGLLILFAKLFRKKLVLRMTLLGSDDPKAIMSTYRYMHLRAWFLKSINHYIALSTPMAMRYGEAGFPPGRLTTIPNGVDTSIFTPISNEVDKAELRVRLGLPLDRKIVICVCAVIYRKGIDVLLEAWRSVQANTPDVLLLIVGPTSFDELEHSADELNTYQRKLYDLVENEKLDVLFYGPSGDIADLLRASDVFALASRGEGFPNVAVEAMACGLPLVLSDMDGIAGDIIQSGAGGFICGSVSEVSQALTRLTMNKKLTEDMGHMARSKALESFDIKRVAQRYIDVYKLVCADQVTGAG